MDKRTRDTTVAVVAVGAAVVALYFAWSGRAPKINLDPYEVLGAVTAEETAKLLGGGGEVLVLARGTGANINPSVEAELAAFQRSLKKHPGLSGVVERVQVTPMMMMATGGGVPADQFLQALANHAKAGAVVLFFGFPQLTEPELATLQKSGVKTVVVSSLRSGYKQLLERHAIHLVIAPRSGTSPSGAQPPRTQRERFDQEYLILTPAEAAGLP